MNEPLQTDRQLSPDERRRLLAELLQKKASGPVEQTLSFGQERLWLMARLDPGSSLYNIAVAYDLRGPLDLTALQQSVRRIAQRHAVLRATFPSKNGQPVQRVVPEVPLVFEVAELGEGSAAEREARAAQLAAEEAQQPFDLTQGPLWRVKVFQDHNGSHLLVLVMHHIISDAWSFYIFCQELTEFYEASTSGRSSSLDNLPIQYADFGQRQRQRLSGKVFEEHLAYWRSHLCGEVPRLQLPTDRRGLGAMNHRGAFQAITIPAQVTQALGALSQRENATMFMTLLAGFEVLLNRYSGQEDLVLCTPASGRHRSQTKELIGYFNNILPMRFDLRGDPSFVDVVRRTRQVVLGAFRYQDLPFQFIADSPNLKAVSLSRAMFSLDIEWPPKLRLPGLVSEPWAVRTKTADFELSISLWLDGEELRGVFEYKTELFHADTIARMIAEYRQLMELLAERPETAVSRLPARTKSDAGLLEGSSGQRPSIYRPPNSPIQCRIVKEWEDILGIHPINVDDDLLELGASSLAVARLMQRLEGMFSVRLPLTSIFQARTVERIAALVQEGCTLPSSALAAIQPAGMYPPLFLCEGIGIYYPLVHHLHGEQPVYGLATEVANDYPQVEDLASSYLAEVRTVQPQGPYFLGGLSFGGIVAYEMAQQLHAAGEEVAFLAMFDTPTPWAYTPLPPLRRLSGHLANVRRYGFGYVQEKVRRRLRELTNTLRETEQPATDSAAVILADTERQRHRFSATADRYQLRTYPGRVTLFALANRDALSDSMFDPSLGEVDPTLGWDRVAAGGVEVHELSGGHISIFLEPHVRRLAEKLTVCLAAARAQTSKC